MYFLIVALDYRDGIEQSMGDFFAQEALVFEPLLVFPLQLD